MNATTGGEMNPLHYADTLDILNALMDRGADPIVPDYEDKAPLAWQASCGTVDMVARLLQDPRVRATVNMQDRLGRTALHVWAMEVRKKGEYANEVGLNEKA